MVVKDLNAPEPVVTAEIRTDLDFFKFSEIIPAESLIVSIPARFKKEFTDPFPFKEYSSETPKSRLEKEKPIPLTYTLGRRILDQKGGDAGSIYKRSEIVPQIFFVRASFIAKSSATMPHPEL